MRWRPTVTSDDVIMHSAKGSHWKNHKYIKVVDGKYIYPESMGPGLRRLASNVTSERLDEEKRREREKQAQANKSRAQRQGMKRTFDEKERQREAARQRQEREALNERNLEAARNKANARRNQQQKADYDRAALNQRNLNAARKKASAEKQRIKDFGNRFWRNEEGRRAAKKQIREANAIAREQLNDRNLDAARAKKERQDAQARINVRKSARAQQERGKQLTAKLRQQRLAEQRNAAGRTSARRQIEAGNKAAANEAARQRKLNAVNTTRAAQKQGMKRTAQVNEQAKINRNKQQKADYDRAALAKKNLSAARAKALRNQRNAEGAASARRQISNANANARNLEAARNKAARKQTIANGNRAERNMEGRLSARNQIKNANIRSSVRNQGRHINANMVNGASDTRRTTSMRRSLDLGQRVNNIKSIKNPTARKNQARALAEETLYKNVKRPVKKVAKSVSARARAAWNSASSYKDRFTDFESFYKWYKKYGIK